MLPACRGDSGPLTCCARACRSCQLQCMLDAQQAGYCQSLIPASRWQQADLEATAATHPPHQVASPPEAVVARVLLPDSNGLYNCRTAADRWTLSLSFQLCFNTRVSSMGLTQYCCIRCKVIVTSFLRLRGQRQQPCGIGGCGTGYRPSPWEPPLPLPSMPRGTLLKGWASASATLTVQQHSSSSTMSSTVSCDSQHDFAALPRVAPTVPELHSR